MLGETILLGTLAVTAYRDWKEKKIYVCGVLLCGIAGLLLHILFQERALTDMLAGASVGVMVLVIAKIGGECIGMGDGLVLMISGIFLGFWGNVSLLLTALFFAAGTAWFLLVIKGKGRKYRLPFVPFLLAAYLVHLV